MIRIYLSFAAVLVFIGLLVNSSGALAREKLLDIQEVQSESGVTAWLVEDDSVPVISLDFAFTNAGAKFDPAEKQGLARLVSNTMDEGAGELDSQTFQKELRDLSINLGFSASRDTFGGSLKTLSRNKERAFELLHLALTEPRFDEEPLTRMRKANQNRIRSSLADPGWMAARILNDKAYEGHVYAQNSGGTLSTLDAITAEDLRKFVSTYLARDRLHIAVAGDISAAELKVVLDDIFSDLPETAETQPIENTQLQNKGRVFLHVKENLPQTKIEILQSGIDRKDPDYHNAQIMNFVLGSSGFGSRLTEVIREERGLTYGIYSYFSDMEHFNGLAVSTATANKNVPEIIALITEEFNKMRSYPISDEELSDAKSYLIGALPLSMTSTNAISSLLLSLQIDDLPINYLDERQTAIEAATTESVFKTAQKILRPENFVTVLVGNPDIDGLNVQEIETLPNVE